MVGAGAGDDTVGDGTVGAGSAFLSAGLFAFLHDATVFPPLMGLGLMLAWVRECTGTLLVPTLLHGLNNSLAILQAQSLE